MILSLIAWTTNDDIPTKISICTGSRVSRFTGSFLKHLCLLVSYLGTCVWFFSKISGKGPVLQVWVDSQDLWWEGVLVTFYLLLRQNTWSPKLGKERFVSYSFWRFQSTLSCLQDRQAWLDCSSWWPPTANSNQQRERHTFFLPLHYILALPLCGWSTDTINPSTIQWTITNEQCKLMSPGGHKHKPWQKVMFFSLSHFRFQVHMTLKDVPILQRVKMSKAVQDHIGEGNIKISTCA